VGLAVAVALDRHGERCEVGVADGAVGPALGSEHPGGGPAARHVAGRQRLTLRERRRTHSIIDVLAVKGAIGRVARRAACR
jgi:hypothetical protein